MLDEALNMLRDHDGNSVGGVGGYPGGIGAGAVKRKPGSLDSLPMDQQPSSSTSARGRPRSKKSKKADEAEMEEDGSIDGDGDKVTYNWKADDRYSILMKNDELMECTFDQIPSLKGWFWSGQEGPGQAVDKQSKREGEWKTCDRQKNIIF